MNIFWKIVLDNIFGQNKNFAWCYKRYPGNNFAEYPRKFPGIFSGDPREFPGFFHRKIRWKYWQNSEEFLVNHSKKFLITSSEEFLLTHSEEFLITLSKEFLLTNSSEFLITNSAEKPQKMLTKFVKIQGNFQIEILQKFPRISQN